MGESDRSRPHRAVERVLDDMRISYISEHPVDVYSLDVYLPEWNLAIEIDGPYHLKRHDNRRDKELRDNYGIETLRLKVANQYWSQKRIHAAVVEFVEEHANSVKERKARGRQSP